MKRISILIGLLALLLAGSFVGARAMRANTPFTVNSTLDEQDASPGDGQCVSTPSGQCTLRAAIMEANALAGADTIILPTGVYTLTIAGANEDAAATGDLDMVVDLTIAGAGVGDTIVDGNSVVVADRVFHVVGSVTVSMSALSVQNGTAGSANGGGILNGGGELTLTEALIANNTAGLMGVGAGISNLGTLTLTHSSVSNNSAYQGGGITNNGVVVALNSTIDGNTANLQSGGIDNRRFPK